MNLKQVVKRELKQIERKLEKPRYMMATKATHKLGDISSDAPELCIVHSEDGKNYIGNWMTGFGFINVEFPKKTTRELTEEDKDKYNGVQIGINDSYAYTIETKENPIPVNAVKVVTKNSVYHFGKADEKGIRIVSRDEKPFDFKKCVITFLVIGKGMQFYPAGDLGKFCTTSKVLSIE